MSNQGQIVEALARQRILILDGAAGSLLQSYQLTEDDFRGDILKDHPRDLLGNNDLLCLTRPDVVTRMHTAYLEAGADIIETNSFTATSISQTDYATQHLTGQINLAAARLARTVADEFTKSNPERPRLVAGSMGPTNRTASISPDVNDPAHRNVSFDDLVAAYGEQAEALLVGGVDLLMVETVFDTLNAKAAIFAILDLFDRRQAAVPVWVSGTIVDASGRTLSGQTPEAFYHSIRHARPVIVGLNCALGAEALRPYLKDISDVADTLVSVHPNAGLPNEFGGYDDTPQSMAEVLADFAGEGLVNIVGGCCGTTPDHIRSIAQAVRDIAPRKVGPPSPVSYFTGLEVLRVDPESLFVNVGERTNVAGSKKFAKAIKDDDYDVALKIARQQVCNGAQIIDVSMDEALLDGPAAMQRFLRLVASEPEISRVPVMIDSSDWEVIQEGLKCLQGKGVVNSISLKDGVEEFIRRARLVQKFGAVVVVMAFDEEGQATSYQRKVDVCQRAYDILVNELGYSPHDVIFDPNVLTIATGIDEHDNYAVDFIEACRTIKATLPGALVSGGISNLSFAYRGNAAVREAMHSVFLFHAIDAGLDMGIVNPGQLAVYDELPQHLRQVAEEVVLNKRSQAAAELTSMASGLTSSRKRQVEDLSWRDKDVGFRLTHAMVHGITDYVVEDSLTALQELGKALAVIEGPLMDGMNRVGDLFGDGKMFLPQVVKSARVMKRAVIALVPYMDEDESELTARKPKIVLATVKGDVHDIGKNIVGVVLGCNAYDVIDLGVMVPAEEILETAEREQVTAVGLSGLITPSLGEMVKVAAEMERRGMKTPLLIGGATTSRVHTAVKIAPAYSGAVVHVPDASRSVGVMTRLVNPTTAGGFTAKVQERYDAIRDDHERRQASRNLVPIEQARERRFVPDRYQPTPPSKIGRTVIDQWTVDDLRPYIDWTPFFKVWELPGRYPRILENDRVGPQARQLLNDANQMLDRMATQNTPSPQGLVGLWPANSIGDDIEIYSGEDRRQIVATVRHLRQQGSRRESSPCLCLADFVAARKSGQIDYMGAFVVSAGLGIDQMAGEYEKEGDDYNAIMVKALADRLAEAMAEKTHEYVRRQLWGYDQTEAIAPEHLLAGRYQGIRPAPGYPACPDHSQKQTLFELLDATARLGVALTDRFVMQPVASVSGWYLAHPQAQYFAVGRLGKDQVADYAVRRGIASELAEDWLAAYLGYQPLSEEPNVRD